MTKNKNSVKLLVFALIAAGHQGCGSDTDGKNPIINSDKHSESYSYDFEENGCKTQRHEFKSKKSYCEGLNDGELNHYCAETLRYLAFKQECADQGIQWAGVIVLNPAPTPPGPNPPAPRPGPTPTPTPTPAPQPRTTGILFNSELETRFRNAETALRSNLIFLAKLDEVDFHSAAYKAFLRLDQSEFNSRTQADEVTRSKQREIRLAFLIAWSGVLFNNPAIGLELSSFNALQKAKIEAGVAVTQSMNSQSVEPSIERFLTYYTAIYFLKTDPTGPKKSDWSADQVAIKLIARPQPYFAIAAFVKTYRYCASAEGLNLSPYEAEQRANQAAGIP